MAKGRCPSPDEISMMVAAAQLIYYKGKTQEEVGEILGVSRPKVSRLLSQAREHGIIEINVRNPISHNSDVQAELEESFGLKNAIVTPICVDKQEIIVPQLASAAASFIVNNLPERAVLGLGRGYTMYETVQSFLPTNAPQPTIVPLSGGVGSFDAGTPFEEILNRTATALGGECKFLYAPALLSSEKFRDAILAEPKSMEVVQFWDKMDWVVMGVGTIPPARRARVANPYFERNIRAFTRETGICPVAELSLWLVLPDGDTPATSHQKCLIAATPQQIKRAKVRIAIAGGLIKVRAIYASILSGMINTLVTDERTAEELIKLRASNQ